METTATPLKFSGHYSFADANKKVDVWLEEDGFFKLRYEEKDGTNVATNEERGTYGGKGNESFHLASVERQWKWVDGEDSDSGVDATDLHYPASLNNNTLTLNYLDNTYSLQSN